VRQTPGWNERDSGGRGSTRSVPRRYARGAWRSIRQSSMEPTVRESKRVLRGGVASGMHSQCRGGRTVCWQPTNSGQPDGLECRIRGGSFARRTGGALCGVNKLIRNGYAPPLACGRRMVGYERCVAPAVPSRWQPCGWEALGARSRCRAICILPTDRSRRERRTSGDRHPNYCVIWRTFAGLGSVPIYRLPCPAFTRQCMCQRTTSPFTPSVNRQSSAQDALRQKVFRRCAGARSGACSSARRKPGKPYRLHRDELSWHESART